MTVVHRRWAGCALSTWLMNLIKRQRGCGRRLGGRCRTAAYLCAIGCSPAILCATGSPRNGVAAAQPAEAKKTKRQGRGRSSVIPDHEGKMTGRKSRNFLKIVDVRCGPGSCGRNVGETTLLPLIVEKPEPLLNKLVIFAVRVLKEPDIVRTEILHVQRDRP